ncbi:MAG: hypothetical protein IT365_29780 [Candidatus Hydrogenedentes bacterium]|nr:hypothetical protein [Candidatus Hydrogenedentota bacterium]
MRIRAQSTRRMPRTALLCALFAALYPSLALATGPIETRGEGTALGLGPAARSEAIREAQRAMVISRLETLAPTRDFSAFATLIEKPETYVPAYRVLSESKTEDSTHVEIAGDLLDAKLRQDAAACLLEGNGQRPRVALIVTERIEPSPPRALAEKGVAESAIAEKLRIAQFEVVESKDLIAEFGEEQIRLCAGGSPDVAAQIARHVLADIAVLGAVTTVAEREEGKTASDLKRCRAHLRLRIIRASDAYVLDELETDAELYSADVREGGATAVEDACEKCVPALTSTAALGMLAGTPDGQVYVTIDGLGNGTQLEAILAALRSCPGMGEIQEMYTSDTMVRVAAAFSGSMRELVDAVASRKYAGVLVKIQSVINRDVTIKVSSTPTS